MGALGDWGKGFIDRLSDDAGYTPTPDTAFTRIYWDEQSQSVKHELISARDVYIDPTNKSGGSNDATS